MDYIGIILDVGSLMLDDGDINSISNGIDIIHGLLRKKLLSESKDEIALILCGSHKTLNALDFENIVLLKKFDRVDWTHVTCLEKNDDQHCCDEGDLLKAIVVAADHLVNHLRGKKVNGSKRLMVISNLERNIDFTQVDQVVEGLDKETIELNVISNEEFHYVNKHEPSTSDGHINSHLGTKLSDIRKKNECELSKIVSKLHGSIYSFDDVLSSVNIFETKSKKSIAWKVNLEISNLCQLSLVGYLKITEVKPPKFTQCYGGDPTAEVEKRLTYQLNDGNNTSVDVVDTIKGFKYGNTLVPCTDEDIESMKLTVEKGLKLIGFCEEENVSRNLYVGDSCHIFFANNPSSTKAFESLVQSMYEGCVVALVRRVYSCNSAPRLAVLTPIIKKRSLSLAYHEIAFGEDIRPYTFPSLPGPIPRDQLVDPKRDKHTFLSETQLNAADSLIDNMMLLKKNKDSEKEEELYKPSDIVSPYIQMFYQCVAHRLSHPNEKLPQLSDQIQLTLQPPEEHIGSIDECITVIKSHFNLKEKDGARKQKKTEVGMIPQQAVAIKICKMETDEQKPMASGDVIASAATDIGSVSNVEDFLEQLKRGQISQAISGMQNHIWELINLSYLDTVYPQAIICLIELRRRVIEYSSTDVDLISQFNEFLWNMKSRLLSSLSKKDFWTRLKKENLTLIAVSESELGCHETDEQAFFVTKVDPDVPMEQKVEDMDTLYDDM